MTDRRERFQVLSFRVGAYRRRSCRVTLQHQRHERKARKPLGESHTSPRLASTDVEHSTKSSPNKDGDYSQLLLNTDIGTRSLTLRKLFSEFPLNADASVHVGTQICNRHP